VQTLRYRIIVIFVLGFAILFLPLLVASPPSYARGGCGDCSTACHFAGQVCTAVADTSTSNAWSGAEVAGASAYDTSRVFPSLTEPAPSGTMTYHFYTDGSCGAADEVTTLNGISWPDTETLNPDGSVPSSQDTGPLVAGQYSFLAVYSGDSNYVGSAAPCELFTVLPISTAVFDYGTSAAWSGTEVVGASAYDTSMVTEPGFMPEATGTVTYYLYTGGSCSAVDEVSALNGISWPEMVNLASGNVPNSQVTGALAAGPYSFQAVYSGDGNYEGATSPCEPFSVIGINTVVFDSTTNAAWSGTEVTGASAYDTSSVTGGAYSFDTGEYIVPTGTVTYYFYQDGTCGASPGSGADELWTDAVALSGGAVPISQVTGALAAGQYSFQAVFSGEANTAYAGISYTSPCEPFSVIGINTVVFDSTTNAAWSGTEVTGASAYDTSTVKGVSGVPPTGTVTYSFYMGAGCSGTPTTTQMVTLAGGAVPQSASSGPLPAGSYSYQASYSGDSNYAASTSLCENFVVLPATLIISTAVSPSLTPALGASVSDTATATAGQVSGFPPTGTVTITLFSGSGCGAVIGSQAGVSLGTTSTAEILPAGQYSYEASAYTGDTNYVGTGYACESFAVQQAVATITTTVNPGTTLLLGTPVSDTPAATGVSSFAPAGTVTISLYPDSTCAGIPTFIEGDVPLGTASSALTALTAGPYSFQASLFSDIDGNYVSGTSSACEPFIVQVGTASVVTTLQGATLGGTVPLGSSVGDTAVVTFTPSGYAATGGLTYNFFDNSGCSGTPTYITSEPVGTSAASQGPLEAGGYSWDAQYVAGVNDNYQSSNPSSCESFTVLKAQATISTTVEPSSVVLFGTPTYDTGAIGGVVSGFTPTGIVRYSLFSTATCSGSYSTQGVTLSGGTVPSSTPQSLTPGQYSYMATYSGDSNYLGAPSSCEPFNVQTATTTVVACLPLTVIVGVPEICTAVVANNDLKYNTAPTGTVSFSGSLPGGMPTSCVLSGGKGVLSYCTVTWTTGKGTEGTYKISASYGGDPTHAASSSGQWTLQISKRGVSVSMSCSGSFRHGSPITCTVTLTDTSPGTPITPTGTISFSGSLSIPACSLTPLSSTKASCQVTFTASSPGSYFVTANYGGDADHSTGWATTSFKVA